MFQLGLYYFDDWQSFPLKYFRGYSDTFILHIHPEISFAPKETARIIRRITQYMKDVRPRSSLWIKIHQVYSQSFFYRYLYDLLLDSPYASTIPFAISGQEQPFDEKLFTGPLLAEITPMPPPYQNHKVKSLLDEMSLNRAKVFVNMFAYQEAFSIEVASACGVAKKTALKHLEWMREKGYVNTRKNQDNYDYWYITTSGNRYVKQRLNTKIERVKKLGVEKFKKRSDYSESVNIHQRTKRLWVEWIKKSKWGKFVKIYNSWSEFGWIQSIIADSVAWGELEGTETLFWCEVYEDYHIDRINKSITRKIALANELSSRYNIPIVLTILANGAQIQRGSYPVERISPNVAVVISRYRYFASLPLPRFGNMVIYREALGSQNTTHQKNDNLGKTALC